MHFADYLSVALAALTILTFVLAYLEKLPYVKKRPGLAEVLAEADTIAGLLKSEIPPGSTRAQVEQIVAGNIASGAVKLSGNVSQADMTVKAAGAICAMLPVGHLLPSSAAPAVSEVAKLTARVEALLDQMSAQPAAAPATPPPAPVAVPFTHPAEPAPVMPAVAVPA